TRRVTSLISAPLGLIGVASVALAAACISGLPAASCHALADTYATARWGLGTTAIFAAMAHNFGGTVIESAEFEQRARSASARKRFGFIAAGAYVTCLVHTLLTFWFALTTIAEGAINIRVSVAHCFVGDEAHRKDAAGTPIKLM